MNAPQHSLAELLARDRESSNTELFLRASELESQIEQLSDEQTNELASRLRDAWPPSGFASLIELREARSFTINAVAVGWLIYAPALDLEPTPTQWAEIVVSGVSLDHSRAWLQRHWSAEAVPFLIDDEVSPDARVWEQIVASIPARLPEEVVDALTAKLRTFTDQQSFEIHRIGERFVAEQRLEALQDLSAVDSQLEVWLRTYRGQLGDHEALQHLFKELKASLTVGSVDRDSVGWLEGAKNSEFLPDLFECLFLARSDSSNPFGPSGMLEYVIAEIGGEEVVVRYDDAIAARPFEGAQFLRSQRDSVAQRELKAIGDEGARRLADAAGVPLLTSDY
jgi:hypothetical protein